MASKKDKWGTPQLRAALQRVSNKEISLRQAALQYGIPRSTLSDHKTGKSTSRCAGAPTVLSHAEESEIVIGCQVLAEMGFPLDKAYVSAIVGDYLKQQGKPNAFGESGLPGRNWWDGFLRRHPQLAQRKPQHLSRKRAEANDSAVLDEWFQKVQHLFETSGMTKFDQKDIGQRVWNCDETGFCTAVASKLVLTKRGTRAVHEVGGGSGREYITVLGNCKL